MSPKTDKILVIKLFFGVLHMGKMSPTRDDVNRGNRIKAVRKKNRLTQENLAEILNVSVSTVKKLESGENNITIHELKCLRDEFGISSDFILFGDVQDNKHYEYFFESVSGDQKLNMLLKILLNLCSSDNKKYREIIEELIKNTN